MASRLLPIVAIFTVITVMGYYAYSHPTQTDQVIQKYVPAQYQIMNSVGDIATMNLDTATGTKDTKVYNYETPVTQNTTEQAVALNNGTHVTVSPNQSSISLSGGETYGQTSLYSSTNAGLPADTWKIGTPVHIFGTLRLVKPDSCVLINGQAQCQYVTPPLFDYLVEITCKIPTNDHCSMDNQQKWLHTDGSGGYDYVFDTSPVVMKTNAGPYLVTVSANSQVLQTSGVPFQIVVSKIINLVN